LLHTRGRGGGDEKNWLIHRTKEQPERLADGGGSAGPAVARQSDRPSDGHDGAHRAGQRRISGAADAETRPSERRTMQATLSKGEPRLDPADWAFEMKWDG
ncbi:hypothetical protein, partial [Pseudomonas viridiflava]|uniref:hypothetical protein n=1 Tax=Pseudomonas viridiflava TaxID=33069 RepID=UPI00197FB9A8